MRTRKIYLAVALAVAVALAAAAAVAGGVGITHAATGLQAAPVTATVTIPGTEEVWAPPPANAAPSLTPDQAWAKFSAAQDETSVPAGTSAPAVRISTAPLPPIAFWPAD